MHGLSKARACSRRVCNVLSFCPMHALDMLTIMVPVLIAGACDAKESSLCGSLHARVLRGPANMLVICCFMVAQQPRRVIISGVHIPASNI